MNFLEIVRFEIDYRLRRPYTWILGTVFVAMAWLLAVGVLVGEAERAGDLHANAPSLVGMATVLVSMLGLVISAALFSEAALRDHETRMFSLFATSPLTKTQYLAGRFAGTLLVNVLIVSIVPIMFMLLMRPPFVKGALLGPFRAAAYVQPALVLLLPNVLFTGALLFAVGVLTRRTLAVFATAAFVALGAMLLEEYIEGERGLAPLAALIDPSGFVAFSEHWEFWTTHEKNTRPLHVDASLLWNRLLWTGVTGAVLLFTRWRFRTNVASGRRKGRREGPVEVSRARVSPCPSSRPFKASFDGRARIRQFAAIAGESARGLLFNRDFAVIAVLQAIMVLSLGTETISDDFRTPFWPLTQFVAEYLVSFLPALTMALLTTFYAGELVHRERSAGLAEIADANPVPDWILYAGKFAALGLVLVTLQAVLMASGLIAQLAAGYFHLEIGLYLRILFGLELADYLLLAALAMLVHVVVDNKYLGHVVVVICHLFTMFAARFGLHHNLLVYGRDSGWTYSDISQFGPFLRPVLWFKLYWGGWALLFAVIAGLLWIRGRDRGVATRLRLARQRFGRRAAVTTALAALTVIGAGGFIFYNTNVLAGYRTPFEAAGQSAEYERRYGKFESAPQPAVTGTKLHVEIDPERRVVEVRGTYTLVNRTAAPIRTIHLFLNPEVETRAVSFDRGSRVVIADDALGHRTVDLVHALERDHSLQMTFDVRFVPRGFPNRNPNTSVVRNGTYFDHDGGGPVNHRRWLPLVGYQTSRELSPAHVRREHGLPPRPRAPSVRDASRVEDAAGSETITFDAVIGTSPEQTAVAPGTLLRSWNENGRRYFHYATERPVRNAFAIFSARYAVHRETWNGVVIELFYHPTHTFNVERFARGVRASLDYYTKTFGPYPHRQIRIVEFPRYANLAQTYPGTIAQAETMGWLTKVEGSHELDLASMTVAHEVAHQWWGFQVTPAAIEGGPAVSEVLAQYSALMVIEKLYGMDMVRRFLWNTRVEYLNQRSKADHPEVPLLDVTSHANVIDHKGPLVMYALRQYVGEEPLNAALRRLVATHGSGRPPFATSRDLYRELKGATPPEYHYLLKDLLETITLWNLRTTAIAAEPAGNGAWRVTLDVEAQKFRADGSGKETEVPMNDLVEIGVFGDATADPLYLQEHRIRSGRQRISVVVKGTPERAGVDPQLLLIDRNWSDNLRPVIVEQSR
ncbi:MAG TPA: M1 family aminopeptidase [Thermoanaerobaculia bacterium]|nr:M1 family aminopeptidase [Thermoanaerobaculia bacterium]